MNNPNYVIFEGKIYVDEVEVMMEIDSMGYGDDEAVEYYENNAYEFDPREDPDALDEYPFA